MNEHTIKALGDDEFEDELKENLGWQDENGHWALFANPQNVRRTQRFLEEMVAKVEQQLEKYGDERPDWFISAKNFHRLVSTRLKQVNRVIHGLEGAGAERERKLRAFAHELCEALEGSDHEYMLDEIFFPFGGKEALSAGDWYDRRLQKREDEAAKAAGSNVVSIAQALDALELERAA